MSTGAADELPRVFQGLADINRLRIINLLLQREELCVCDIERVLDIPQTRVSRHLAILRNAGLVSARREGRWMHYRLIDEPPLHFELLSSLQTAFASVDQFMRDAEALEHAQSIACDIPTETSCKPLPPPR
ncbi:MAG: helix-turn-helix transcriptional regulator [Bacteroidetes bacterium]|nr:helix-turn-helix transcriptional regulator [Bacteroidota bacterium]